MNCHGCGTANELDGRVGRGDVCSSCRRPLRCCMNCELYSPTAHNKCREPQSEWVPDREVANFCEYFSPSRGSFDSATDKADQARKKLDDLFK